jgi:ATP dependent DNA ligase domain
MIACEMLIAVVVTRITVITPNVTKVRILARHQLGHPAKIRQASQRQPVTYVVFDLLAYQGRRLLGQPLQARRALLQDLLARWQQPRLQFSEGIVGPGKVFFEQAVRHGQEGVMAKHLASRYLPGKRSACWLKIKPACRLPCVIIGWQPGVCGLSGLLVAAPWGGALRYVANVRTGFSDQEAARGPWCVVRTGRCGSSRSFCARSIIWRGREQGDYAAPASMACLQRRERVATDFERHLEPQWLWP